MTLSRKDFFRHSIYSLGKTVLSVGESVREAQASLYGASLQAEPAGELEHDGRGGDPEREAGAEPASGPDMVARVDNRHCMARSCGCFSCTERCEAGAIILVMGEGIRIAASLCTGCGDCYRVCPLAPEALRLVPRG